MNKFLVFFISIVFVGCSPKTELVEIFKGDPGKDGTSCTVSPELADSEHESAVIIGSRISCTDGSYSVVLNGAQGIQGEPGVPGQNGVDGVDGKSCQAYRLPFLGTFIKCPGQWPVAIKDGRDGKDGDSCKSVRQNSKKRVKITCGKTVTYVYDGKNGANGESCTATSASGGAYVQCGNNSPVFIANGSPGPQGTQGPQGEPGRDGLDGTNGEDAIKPGLSCNVHDLSSWNGVTNILTVLASSAPVGNFTLENLSVGNSKSKDGFPGMPSEIQSLVGLDGYALDCNGYLNIKTSGLYNFSMLSDDGVRLVIDGKTIINSPGLQAPTTTTATSVELNRGQRTFNVIYYQGPHTQIALRLMYSGPNLALQVVPSSEFTH